MSNLSWVPRVNVTKTIVVTPTISTSAYTSGDQVGGIMTLTDAIRVESNTAVGNAILAEVTIIDADKQDVPFDIKLFKISPTLASSDNAAYSITDANLALASLGNVKGLGLDSSAASNYSDNAANSESSNPNLNKPVQGATSSIYAVAVVRGAPTYTTTTSLQFQFTFYVD